MDADGRIIEIVEDDMGEGMKDPLDLDELLNEESYLEKLRKLEERQKILKDVKSRGKVR